MKYPTHMYFPDDCPIWKKALRIIYEFSASNSEYGIIYVPSSTWRVVRWLGFPMAAYIAAQHGAATSNGLLLAHYFVGSLFWGNFVTWFLIRTQADDWLSKEAPPRQLPIDEIVAISPDTFLIHLKLDDENQGFGLPIGQHVRIHIDTDQQVEAVKDGEWNGQAYETGPIGRMYTPISTQKKLGGVDLVIKAYDQCDQFPDGGRASRYFLNCKVGDMMTLSGPMGKYEYVQGGGFRNCLKKTIKWEIDHVNMVAGGSGITPMLQIINGIIADPWATHLQVNLIFGNRTPDDVLCKPILDQLVEEYSDRLRIHYTVDSVGKMSKDQWNGSIGYIDKAMMDKHCAPCGERTQWFMCGPLPMRKGVQAYCDANKQPGDMIFGGPH